VDATDVEEPCRARRKADTDWVGHPAIVVR
jgi:hypothetical protein